MAIFTNKPPVKLFLVPTDFRDCRGHILRWIVVLNGPKGPSAALKKLANAIKDGPVIRYP